MIQPRSARPEECALPATETPDTLDSLLDLPVRELIDRAAASTPEPGGGSVAALGAALAAGLAGMVCALTVERPKYHAVADEIRVRQSRLAELRHRLADLIDEDVCAYGLVMAAYQLPKATEAERAARDAAVAHGLIAAIKTPLELADRAAEVVDHAAFVARNGNRTATDDAVLAALFAHTAARGALLNLATNLRLLRPERTPPELADRAERARVRVAALSTVIAELSSGLSEAQ